MLLLFSETYVNLIRLLTLGQLLFTRIGLIVLVSLLSIYENLSPSISSSPLLYSDLAISSQRLDYAPLCQSDDVSPVCASVSSILSIP